MITGRGVTLDQALHVHHFTNPLGTLWGRHCYYPRCTTKENEALRDKNDTISTGGAGSSLSDYYLSIYLPPSLSHIYMGIRIVNCGLNHESVHSYKWKIYMCPYITYFLRKNQRLQLKKKILNECNYLFMFVCVLIFFLQTQCVYVLSVLLNTKGRARWGLAEACSAPRVGYKQVHCLWRIEK